MPSPPPDAASPPPAPSPDRPDPAAHIEASRARLATAATAIGVAAGLAGMFLNSGSDAPVEARVFVTFFAGWHLLLFLLPSRLRVRMLPWSFGLVLLALLGYWSSLLYVLPDPTDRLLDILGVFLALPILILVQYTLLRPELARAYAFAGTGAFVLVALPRGLATAGGSGALDGLALPLLVALLGFSMPPFLHVFAEQQRALQGIQEHVLLLDRLASTDALTGLANRRAAEEALARADEERGSARWALALIDLDRFKRVNDEHGHSVGDAVLRGVADRQQAKQRPTDQLARWGGEELALLVLGADLETAAELCERLRRAVASEPVAGVPVTFSAGVAAGDLRLEGADDLLARTDAALYRAKAEGRDRVRAAVGAVPVADLVRR